MKACLFVRDMWRQFPFLLIINTVLLILMSLVDAASILSVAPVIDLFLHPDLQGASALTLQTIALIRAVHVPPTLGALLFIFLGFNALKSVLYIAVRYAILKTKYAVLRNLMVGTFEDFFGATWYFFSSGSQGTFLNTFIRELELAGGAFGSVAVFAATCVQVTLYLAIPMYLSWQVTLVSLGVALVFAAPFLLLGRLGYRLGRQNTMTANEVGSILHESLGSAKIILGFGNQKKSVDSLREAFDIHVRTTLASQTLGVATSAIYRPLGLLVLVIALWVARSVAIPLSDTAALLYALMQVVPLIGLITSEKNAVDVFFPSYEQVLALRRRARSLAQRSGHRAFSGFRSEIALERVSFAYPGVESTLIDINVRIPKGEMIAFVGGSGAGKSTLIDVIMGFNEPTAGRITFDGVPLQEFEIVGYRRRIGYVPQDSILFNTSIRENLLWAKEDATDEEIRQASRQAHADEFIEQFPNGYDTEVGDRGVRLSGGELQRVALARAVLRRPALLILDEATSSLDSHSERLIQEAIETIAKETTVVVIAHRLSTIMNADYIYVMRDGRIIEEGTYDGLLAKAGDFARMVALQSLTPVA